MQILAADPKVKRTMVFVETKRAADVVSTYLNDSMLKSTTINGYQWEKSGIRTNKL
jgi:superfamily II DNA/RNA helicase